jgi:hypothetical protein
MVWISILMVRIHPAPPRRSWMALARPTRATRPIAFDWFKSGYEQRVSAPVASQADPDPDHELLHAVDDI